MRLLTLAVLAACALPCCAQTPPMTVAELRQALAQPGDANALVEKLRAWYGAENLKRGANPKVSDLDVAWAIETGEPANVPPPEVISDDGSFRLALKQIGASGIYAATAHLAEGQGFHWTYVVTGANRGGGNLEVYSTPLDMKEQPGVPKGKLIQMPPWKSQVFAGTTRNWWVYVPAQYTPDKPACVMVFQDGGGAKNYTPTCFDNLIARGQMPVTIGVFIDPGTRDGGGSNRSFEYDTLSDQYSRFLLDEILPEVEKSYKLRHDPESRAISGASSGGICAFTVAWERPDQFSKVLSWVGSFTNIASGPTLRAGGHNYPAIIRKTPKKPIRVFLQDGENDLDNVHGNWPLANQSMAKALAFAGYDYKFAFGHGFHSDRHGRAVMPDSLRWLWAGYKPGP